KSWVLPLGARPLFIESPNFIFHPSRHCRQPRHLRRHNRQLRTPFQFRAAANPSFWSRRKKLRIFRMPPNEWERTPLRGCPQRLVAQTRGAGAARRGVPLNSQPLGEFYELSRLQIIRTHSNRSGVESHISAMLGLRWELDTRGGVLEVA